MRHRQHHHHPHHGEGPLHHRGPGALRHYVRARLHRRLFFWFGASILVTGLVVGALTHLLGGGARWRQETMRLKEFAAGRFERAWDDPAARAELAEAAASQLDVDLRLLDPAGTVLLARGDPFTRPMLTLPVTRGGRTLGSVQFRWARNRWSSPATAFLSLLVACGIVWLAAGKIARRLARPLWELAGVAKDIGSGKLSSRAQLGCHEPGEVGMLADSINDMASRLEKQMADQRELLAGVSHELRTPLARIRLIAELIRDQPGNAQHLDELDREVMEIDALVGQLLASSRLEFSALTFTRLDGADVARRALERAGLSPSLLVAEGEALAFQGDATLVARALANLIDNASRHGGGLRALRVRREEGRLVFEAEDHGAGIAPGAEQKVFEPFVQVPGANGEQGMRDAAGGLGLGLALVQRIAQAHGGRAFATNRPEGGARVGIELVAS